MGTPGSDSNGVSTDGPYTLLSLLSRAGQLQPSRRGHSVSIGLFFCLTTDKTSWDQQVPRLAAFSSGWTGGLELALLDHVTLTRPHVHRVY